MVILNKKSLQALSKRSELKIGRYVTVYPSKILLSPGLVNRLGLSAGDRISFAYDDKNPRDWYLFPDPENGIELRILREKGNDGSLVVYSLALSRRFKNFFSGKLQFPVAKDPAPALDGRSMYAIFTVPQYNEKVAEELVQPSATRRRKRSKDEALLDEEELAELNDITGIHFH